MNTAGDLACCEECGNHIAFGVKNFSIGVDDDTAHGVVNTCSDLDSIEGSSVKRSCKADTAEVGVVLVCNIAIQYLLKKVVKGLAIYF